MGQIRIRMTIISNLYRIINILKLYILTFQYDIINIACEITMK